MMGSKVRIYGPFKKLEDLRVETETVRPFNRGLSIQPKKIPLEQVFPSLVIGGE